MILYDKEKMNDVSVVGGKGLGLAKLVCYGCNVPDFFVIAAGTVLDDDFAVELQAFAAKLHCDIFSVRSSGVQEDAAENSFAGQFLTLLNVAKADLYDAVKKVADSARTNRAERYSEHFSTSSAQMAIVVQKQIVGKKSGVLFTRSLSSPDELLIESVEGAGEQLVGGAVTPVKKIVKKGDPVICESYETELIGEALRLEKAEGALDIEWTFADKLYFLQMRPLTVVGDVLPRIPERNWNLYVYRDFCVLAHSVQCRATERDLQERVFGFSVPIREGLLVNGREFYSDENDEAANSIWSSLDKDDFFDGYIKDIKTLVRRTDRHVNDLKNKCFKAYSLKRLFSSYTKEMNAYIQSYVPLMMRPDDYLLAEIQKHVWEFSAETADILTPVWRKSYYSAQKEDFLRAKISDEKKVYLEKYEWTLSPLGKTVVHLTDEDMEKRLGRISVAQAEDMLEKIKKSKAQKKRRFCAYIENYSDNPEMSRLLRLISEFIFLRTYTAESSDRLFYYIRQKILTEISQRLQIPLEEILCMTYQEVAQLSNGQRISKSTIAKRKSGELITFFDGENSAYYGGTVGALLKDLLPQNDGKGDGLCGDVACSGEVRGRVKIVGNFEQTDKVEEGDIVVTSMTTPEIVSALEKAAGIITDEGGVTCHAAIIAREYGIPCLVGTKCATLTLSDGDNVYLDCIHGNVTLLSDE